MQFEDLDLDDAKDFDVVVTSLNSKKKLNQLKNILVKYCISSVKFYTFKDNLPLRLEDIDNHNTVGFIHNDELANIVNIQNPHEKINYIFRPSGGINDY